MAIDLTHYNALLDDSGGNADGTFWAKARILDLIHDIDTAYGGNIVTTSATGTQNDFNIDTIGATTGGVILCNNATLLTLTGLNNPVGNARYIVLVSIGAGQVDISNQDTGSSAANRIINGLTNSGSKISLAPGSGKCGLFYDTATARWRVLWHDQGAWIDYAASSTVTGWASFTTKAIRYRLSGRQLSLSFQIAGTSNATSATFTMPYLSANVGFGQNHPIQAIDNGTVKTSPGLSQPTLNSATMNLFTDWTGAAWTGSGSKTGNGNAVIEIQ